MRVIWNKDAGVTIADIHARLIQHFEIEILDDEKEMYFLIKGIKK